MKVVVETPRGSRVKYRFEEGAYKPEDETPFPTLFNYGFIKNTVGGDGMPVDAIVLGGRLAQGSEVDAVEVGTVHFTDDGLKDDKKVTSLAGTISLSDKLQIHVFFTVYMLYKIIHHLIRDGRVIRCRYGGLSLLPRAR
jgi:inorganic pyrophosphatase